MCFTAARGARLKARSMCGVGVVVECLGATVGVVTVTLDTRDAITGLAVGAEIRNQTV